MNDIKKDLIYAGIVTFNPDIERLSENIESVINQVSSIVIFDNGSENINEITRLAENNNVFVIKSTKNVGIAKGLNEIFQNVVEQSYNWVLTLDQDSICPNNLICEFEKESSNFQNVGIFCPIIDDLNRNQKEIISNDAIEVKNCITSASLTSIQAWKDIDGFDESLFIDNVDFDFCKRLRINNFKIVQVRSVALSHEIGKVTNYTIFGKTFTPMNHSAFRKYYIARNSIYFGKKFRDESVFRGVLRNGKLFLMTLFFENQKKDKLKAICKGFYDGIKM